MERFDLWNALLASLAVLVFLVAAAWFTSDRNDLALWAAWLVGGSACGALLAVVSSARRDPVRLRWDSQHWYSIGHGSGDLEDGPWRVRVSMDWGGLMLLRLESPDDTRSLIPRCVPVQRVGLRGDWHALRCAVSAQAPEAVYSTAGGATRFP